MIFNSPVVIVEEAGVLLSPNTDVNERSSTKALVNEGILLEKPIKLFIENY